MMATHYTRRQIMQLAALAGGVWLVPRPIAPTTGTIPTRPAEQCLVAAPALFDLAATVEALSITFYYTAITTSNGFFANLPTALQRYLRVTLDEERVHYDLLVGRYNASPSNTTFYFPATLFEFGQFGQFLSVMEQFEQQTVALYLAAIRQIDGAEAPVTAAVFAQLAGSEAEQRTMSREMAQNGPPAPNNFCFESADLICAENAIQLVATFLQGGPDFSGPFALPSPATIDAAVGTSNCVEVATASAATCAETLETILQLAAAAEALGITFYYEGIRGGFFAGLPDAQQWYLQAALDEERNHLDFLMAHGAAAPPAHFFFPAGLFADLDAFLGQLDLLENIFIGAYLAAIQRLRQLGEPLLAEVAAQILGVEAEHRVLGRVMAGAALPSDRSLAATRYSCLSEALDELAPFLAGNANYRERIAVPDATEIDAAVDRFGCTPVPTASIPPALYLPIITGGQ